MNKFFEDVFGFVGFYQVFDDIWRPVVVETGIFDFWLRPFVV